jgi:hypothetical protein
VANQPAVIGHEAGGPPVRPPVSFLPNGADVGQAPSMPAKRIRPFCAIYVGQAPSMGSDKDISTGYQFCLEFCFLKVVVT